MKKHISASASSSSLLDSVGNLLSKLLNKFIDSLFSDDNYDKKTDDKVSEEAKKAAEQARSKKDKSTTNEQDEQKEKNKNDYFSKPTRMVITPKDGSGEIIIEIVPWADTGDLFVVATNKANGKVKSVNLKNHPSESKIESTIEDLVTDVTASKRINVTLNRIVGESEDTIDITAIKCSYGIDSAYSDICAVLDDDEFINTVPEGESSYRILPKEDDYIVDEYDGEVDSSDIYVGAFDCATSFYSCLFYLHINKSYFSTEFASLVESLKYSAQYHMDTIAKWAKMHNKSAEITLCYCPDCCDTECPSAWMILETALSDYKNCLDALYSCATHEEQSVIDSWLLDIDYALYNVNNATL